VTEGVATLGHDHFARDDPDIRGGEGVGQRRRLADASPNQSLRFGEAQEAREDLKRGLLFFCLLQWCCFRACSSASF
jgi:hypothetical protein